MASQESIRKVVDALMAVRARQGGSYPTISRQPIMMSVRYNPTQENQQKMPLVAGEADFSNPNLDEMSEVEKARRGYARSQPEVGLNDPYRLHYENEMRIKAQRAEQENREAGVPSRANHYPRNQLEVYIAYTPANFGHPGDAYHTRIPGAYHAVLVVKDPVTGQAFATRAGPDGGFLKAETRAWQDSVDYPDVIHEQKLGTISMPIEIAREKMNIFGSELNAAEQMYTHVNSNSYAFSMARQLGFDKAEPPSGLWAPGSKYKVPAARGGDPMPKPPLY